MDVAPARKYRLSDSYRFEGFRPQEGKVRGIFGKPQAKILPMKRRSSKTCCGKCGTVQRGWHDSTIKLIRDLPFGTDDDKHLYLEIEFRRVSCQRCGKVQSERLEWVGDNPLYTKRFSNYVGKRCCDASFQSVAEAFDLDLKTVKEMSKNYKRSSAAKVDTPAP
jgi:transposase